MGGHRGTGLRTRAGGHRFRPTIRSAKNFLLACGLVAGAGRPRGALLGAAATFRFGPPSPCPRRRQRGSHLLERFESDQFSRRGGGIGSIWPRRCCCLPGGKGKGGDIGAFIARIAPRVRRAYLIGETRHASPRLCGGRSGPTPSAAPWAEACAAAGAADAGPGDHILLSPHSPVSTSSAATKDRGDQFEQLVRDVLAPPSRSAAPPRLFPNSRAPPRLSPPDTIIVPNL